MTAPLNIGKAGQGFGQALRTAVTMAALTKHPIRLSGLKDDRARPRPGLGPAGRTLLLAASRITGGVCEAIPDDLEAELLPGSLCSGDYEFDVSLEASLCSPAATVIEPLILPLSMCREPSSVLVRGATHMLGATTGDEFSHVIMPMLRSLGLRVSYSEIAPGFFPRGRGESELRVEPAGLIQPLKAEHSFQPHEIGVEVVTCGLPLHLAEQAAAGAEDRLGLYGLKPEVNIRRAQGGPGMALLAWASSGRAWAGYSALGRQGGRPDSMALEAVEAMLAFLSSGAGVPSELAAFILPTLACAQGVSHISVDRVHPGLKAAARVIEAFWPDTVAIDTPAQGGPSQVRVRGKRLF